MTRITGRGLVARLTPIRGVTPGAVLNGAVYFPALLNDVEIDEQALFTDYDTLTGGQFSQPAMGGADSRQLRTMGSIESIVVDYDAPYLVATGQGDPYDLRRTFLRILRYRQPVLLFVFFNPGRRQPGVELYMFCTFRSVNTVLRGGEVDARYLTIGLSEWRDPSTSVRSTTPPPVRKPAVTLPTTHRLTASDTLWSLSQAFYGRYDYWWEIRNANGITTRFGAKTPVVRLGGRWKVGTSIKIPKVIPPGHK